MFPGLVHLAEYNIKEGYLEKTGVLLDKNDNLMMREGHIIDSNSADACPSNSISHAHYVNHVPQQKHPNVIQIPFDFPMDVSGDDGFPKRLRKFIPNKYSLEPTFFGTPDRSMVN